MALATGNRIVFDDTPLLRSLQQMLPEALRTQVALDARWQERDFGALLVDTGDDDADAWQVRLAARPGPILDSLDGARAEMETNYLGPLAVSRAFAPALARSGGGAIVLKTGLDPTQLVSQLRAAVQQIDPEQPITDVRTMEEWIDRSLEIRRAPTTLLTIFGAVALLLSAIGIYGVLAYQVSQRRREIGIRMALGAGAPRIFGLVLGEGALIVGVGAVLGLIGAFFVRRTLESLLYGVGAMDAMVVTSVAALLIAVAVVACIIPARRAARTDPTVALTE